MQATTPNIQQSGKLKRSIELARSAWRVFKLDKELIALPAIGMAVIILAVALLATSALIYVINTQTVIGGVHTSHVSAWIRIPFFALVYFVVTLIGNIFSGAVVYGATERFRGGDPTVRSSMRGALHKFKPLILFSLLASSVGLILQAIEQRVPFAGRIAVWLASASWSLATVFALPVIVLSEENIGPLDATKKSAQTIRKVWGESVVTEAGVGLLGVFVVFGIMVVSAAVSTLLFPVVAAGIAFAIGIIGGLAVIASILVLVTLSSIVKAALYHYATTGIAPESFNQDLLRTSMTPKKARKVFA